VLALVEASSIGGTAKVVLELGREARADERKPRGIDLLTALFVRGDENPANTLTRALDEARIPYAFVREKGRFDASVIPQIERLAAEHRANLIWTNSVKSHFLVSRSQVRNRVRWVVFHHGYTYTDFKMRLYNGLDRVSLRKADRALTVCRPFAEQLAERGVTRERIRVQHVPVRPFEVDEQDVARLRQELGLKADEKVVLTIGRLSKEKGQVDLLRGFAQLKGIGEAARLLIVGDGPERAVLEREAARLSLGARVLFTGQREDAKRFYGMADVFVLPSYTEGTPNVILEAMAAETPIVATAVGGVPELVTNEKNGLLSAAHDIAALRQAISRILESRETGERLAAAAEEVVRAHSPRAFYESMRGIFEETVFC
jgi:glycosyltransferase involved in cell wall biosynthesis